MGTTPALPFPSLPEQRAPAVICTDRHALERCEQCGGKGRLRDGVPCPDCGGGGRIIRCINARAAA